MHPLRTAAAAALLGLTLAACASAARPRLLGEAQSSFGPRVAPADSGRPPRELIVTVSQPASAVVLFVVPGRGAVVVWPADSTVNNALPAGSHTVPARWPTSFMAGDSLGPGLARQPDPRGADSALVRRDAPRTREPEPPTRAITVGYLLLVTTARPLPVNEVRARVEGVTMTLSDDEALNAMGKAVRSVASPREPWAGYAIEVRVR